jgi:hypothetical protein
VYFALAVVTLTPVRVSGPVRVQLEIEQGAETISGQVALEEGTSTEFYGWLELIGHLARAAHAGQSHQDATGQSHRTAT